MDSKNNIMKSVCKRLLSKSVPFWGDVQAYSVKYFKLDLVAALTVAVFAVPQGMAYAVIAGAHPKYGLYAGVFPVIVAALWGSSRYLVSGPTNATAMVVFAMMADLIVGGQPMSSLPEAERMACLFGLAVLTGIIQVGMSLVRMGDLVRFISNSVVVGFSVGVACLIVTGQLKTFLGIPASPSPDFITTWVHTIKSIPLINPYVLGVGIFAIICSVISDKLFRRLPSAFVSVVIVTLIVQLIGLEKLGVTSVGNIPSGFPPISLPPLEYFKELRVFVMPAVAIALLASIEAMSAARTLASSKGDKLNINQEFLGQGLANIVSGLTSGVPVSGSMTRSAVNFMAGAQTRFAGVFTGIISLLIILFFGKLMSYIPMACLAGILMVIAVKMVNKHQVRLTMRTTRLDRYVFLATFLSTVFLGLEKSVFMGVLLSILLYLRKESQPIVKRLTEEELPPLEDVSSWTQCPQVAIYSVEGSLFFGAANELEERLSSSVDFSQLVVILHLRQVHWMDASVVNVLETLRRKCQKKNVVLMLSGVKPQLHHILQQSGLYDQIGGENITPSLHKALRVADSKYLKPAVCGLCMQKNNGICLKEAHEKEKIRKREEKEDFVETPQLI